MRPPDKISPDSVPSGRRFNALIDFAVSLIVRNSETVTSSHRSDGQTLKAAPAGSRSSVNPWHPFRIYAVPSDLFISSDPFDTPDAASDWRKVRVRSGYVGAQAPEDLVGSDGAALPYTGSDMPALTEDPAIGSYVQVLDSVAKHWFWIELDAAGAHTVKNAEEDAGAVAGWDEFPEPNGRIVIGWVDTLTGTATKTIAFNPEPFANRHLYGTLSAHCAADGSAVLALVSV